MTDILAAPRGAHWPSILLARAKATDPTDLDAAIAAGAFTGLRTAVADLGPVGTIAEVASAGLRGRGGGGFPTSEKWRAAAVLDAPRRYVVANGYGSDPAVATDRTLMALDPYAVVEGLAIAALAVGATEAIVAVRADATDAVEAMRRAVAAAEDAGFIGPDSMGPGGDLAMRVETVQGAYMLGEETVLLKALEGKRGQPEQRPPQPSERGLFGAPTVVQNVQTLASVAWILANGAASFAAIGRPDSPGTMLVHVRGLRRSGVAEVPLGTPLRAIVALGGDAPAGRSLKAVLVGGPSGGILPPEQLDVAYDFASLREAGAHVGSGSVIAVDDRSCIVDLARVLTRFCADEACGKTIPCRIGLRRISEIGDRVATGRPRPTDLDLLADLAHDVAESGLCNHERLATLPSLSGMRYFRAELDEHILRSSCPAGVCHPIAVAAGAGTH